MTGYYDLLDIRMPNYNSCKNSKIINEKYYKIITLSYGLAESKFYEKIKLLIILLEIEPNVTFFKSKIYIMKKCPLSEIKSDITEYLEPIRNCFGFGYSLVFEVIQKLWEIIIKKHIKHVSKKSIEKFELCDEMKDVVNYYKEDLHKIDLNFHFIFKAIRKFIKYGTNYIPAIIFLLKDTNFELKYVITPLKLYYVPQLMLNN